MASTDETASGHTVPVLNLAPLTAAKRYANRPEDHEALPEWEALFAQATAEEQ